MATPSECNQQEIVEQVVEQAVEQAFEQTVEETVEEIVEQHDFPNESTALIANEAFEAEASDRQQPANAEPIKTQVSAGIAGTSANASEQPNNKAEPSSAKLIAADSCLNGLTNLNGTKITGKLVAVRKDGNSYTFTTTASAVSGGSTTAKTFTLATPTSKGGNTALITVAKPQHLTLSAGCKAGTLIAGTQRLYYNKTTNTIEHSIAPLNHPGRTQDDLATGKINTAKPIILQMKRKHQVLNDENRKTARIFTIPSSAISAQSNQFIVMNRPKPAASLLASSAGGSIKARMASLAKPITANLSVLDRASLSISNSLSSVSRSSPPVVGEPTASITIVSKQKSNSTALPNKLTTTGTDEHLVDNKIRPKLDAKMLSIEGELAAEPFARPAGYPSTIEQSAACLPNLASNNSASNLLDTSDGDNKIVKIDAENLLGEQEELQAGVQPEEEEEEEETTVELAEETVQQSDVQESEMEETTVEHYDCEPANVSGGAPLEQRRFLIDSTANLGGRRTTMESLIESTIESSFESSARKAPVDKDTCVDACVQTKSVSGNNAANCIKIAQDIEFSPNSVGRSNATLARERSVSLDSLRNGPPPAQSLSMQTDSKRDSLDNLIMDGCMDECAAALVLMSLSFSPKNNHLNLRSPSLISQRVVFQCTWRNCGKESGSREKMEQHVREKHLGISSSNGDHEEDFYYTEIDIFDSNISQDSSGISSGDSPCEQSPTNCCGAGDPAVDEFDDELYEEEKFYNSKLMRAKKLKEIRLERLNKQQSIKGRKTKKNSASLVWTKKGLLKCTNGSFEIKRNRVGRPRRLLSCSGNQQQSAHSATVTSSSSANNLSKKSGKQQPEQTLLRGLEYSVRLSASSPINIPGRIAISRSPAYSNGSNQGLLDLSYNSDQFKVGSIRSNGLLEQCMAKENHRKYPNNHNPNHSSYDFVSSYSTSSSGVQSIDSLGTSVFSINSSLASSSSTTSSSPPSPSLLSNFSTPDQEADWLYANGSDKANGHDDENYLDEVKFNSNANLCNSGKASLFSAHNHSMKKSARSSKDQQENALPFSRSARQTVTLINPQPNGGYSNSLKSQKSAGYYASLHRGIIQPPNLMQQFTNADFANSLQSSNHQTQAAAAAAISKANKYVAVRRSRNGSGNSGKCRKKFGMENKQFWCLQCRWKKACSRVDANKLMTENELSSTLVQH